MTTAEVGLHIGLGSLSRLAWGVDSNTIMEESTVTKQRQRTRRTSVYCPSCGNECPVGYMECASCGQAAPASYAPSTKAVAQASRIPEKSYAGPLVICVLLSFLFVIPGMIATAIYYGDAVRMEKAVGHRLPGVMGLRVLAWLYVILILGPAILFFGSVALRG